MKKILLLSFAFTISFFHFGQLFTDNFDSYTVGSYLGPQSLTWSTWSGTEGGAEDATITAAQSSSNPHSIYFSSTAANGGPQDVILKFGQLYNSGIFTLQNKLYVNTGKKAYYNIQGAVTIGNLWALNVNLNAGSLTIDDGITSNLVSTTYPQATWFELKIVANLTLQVWKAYIDGVLVGTWTNGVNTVASTDFFPTQNSQFYVDDVSFNHQTYTLQNLNAMVSQLNVGGNMDFKNMLERDRLESKKISKTQSVTSQLDYDMGEGNVHIGPSDYVQWLDDRKWAFVRLEGRAFGDVPLTIEYKLEVWDSPNSAGVIIDALRCAKVAMDRGIGGPLLSPSSYFMKSPPEQYSDEEALKRTKAFIAGDLKS